MRKRVLNIFIQFIFVIHRYTVKYIITLCIPKLLLNKFYFFSLLYIRMSGKNINFEDKKILKSNFYKKQKNKQNRRH